MVDRHTDRTGRRGRILLQGLSPDLLGRREAEHCPNSVNAGSQGTLPVSAGWPNFDVSTVEFVPVAGEYDAAFDECQDHADPTCRMGAETAAELCHLAATSDRSASPTWSRVEDVDRDGDLDTKFRFDVADLELTPEDTHLVLRGESTEADCTYFGIDTVRVVGGGNENRRGRSRAGRGVASGSVDATYAPARARVCRRSLVLGTETSEDAGTNHRGIPSREERRVCASTTTPRRTRRSGATRTSVSAVGTALRRRRRLLRPRAGTRERDLSGAL